MGVEGTYRRFVMLVANARHLPPARVNEIAQGRVWDGGTAHQLGLVDRFGNLNDAIAEAARRANLEPADVRPVFLEKEPGWLARLFTDAARDDDDDQGDANVAARDAFAGIARRPEAMIERALHDAQQLLAGPAIQARCLECPAVAPVPRTRIAESLWARLLALVWRG
jgi:protease-4